MSRKQVWRLELTIQTLILAVSLVAMMCFTVQRARAAEETAKDTQQDQHLAYIDGEVTAMKAESREVFRISEDNRFNLARDEGYALGGFAAVGLFQGIGVLVAAFLKRDNRT